MEWAGVFHKQLLFNSQFFLQNSFDCWLVFFCCVDGQYNNGEFVKADEISIVNLKIVCFQF